MNIKYISLTCLSLFLGKISVFCQDNLTKNVEVVKPYVPVVSDALKINSLPVFNDTVIIKPQFDYKILPLLYTTNYQLAKINPAKMVSMPLTKLYNTYIKLGFGNYSTPLAEIYVNSLRSKKYSTGLYLHHQSSGGKLKLANNQKVDAGYADNEASVFGKYFLNKASLYGSAGITGNKIHYYGYDPLSDFDSVYNNSYQKYTQASFNAGLVSNNTDSTNLAYKFDISYKYLHTKSDQAQSNLAFLADGYKLYKKSLIGLKANYKILMPNKTLDSMQYSNTVFSLNPYFINTSEQYRLKLGIDISFENQNDKLTPRIYPDAELSINISKEVLQAFVGITGQIEQHSYYDILSENPFINPELNVSNTYLSSSIYAGLKGSLGERASYIVKFESSKVKNDYFYINDTTSDAQNQFVVEYDDVQRSNLYFEANYNASKSLDLSLSGNYNTYQMDKLLKPWNKPGLVWMFSTKYNLRNKILADIDVVSVGKRYVKEFEPTIFSSQLDGAFEINLGLEYRYTKILSAWFKFNNITGTKYYMWKNYPTQRFNMMFGITYSL
jgi:hypothetical protein